MEEDEIYDKLKDHSVRIAGEATKQALLDQRLAISEQRLEKLDQRLLAVENANLTIKVIQEIHDGQISTFRKALLGNGHSETIPMDIHRIETSVQSILKVDWLKMQTDLELLKKFKDREWQVWIIAIGLIANTLWQIFVK